MVRSLAAAAAVAVIVATAALVPAPSADAQQGMVITTPYPSVAAQPGASIELDLTVAAPAPEPVALTVTEVPAGWTATLRGGGFVIAAVTSGPGEDAGEAQLEVRIPPDAQSGTYAVVVHGEGPSGASDLRLQVVVQSEVDAGIALTADFPSLRGEPGSTFTYTLTIENDTPAEQTFTFSPSAPQGWEISASPTAEAQANTVTIEAGDSAEVRVEATPPAGVPQGEYPITVEVTAATGGSGTIELTAEVAGTPVLELSSADERLNASGEAGQTERVPLIVSNSGTAPLTDVKLAATAPNDWEVSFEPNELREVKPNETAQVVAVVEPAAGAVAGDYAITIRASAGSNSADVDLRYTVKGARSLGLAGIGAIVVALAVLVAAFIRFGRR
jgi:uncharacterized membrane protein